MTERELFEAIGHVDDDLILAADAPVKKRRRVVHLHWQQVVSVAACACIVLGGAAVWRSGTLHKSSIASEAAMAADVPEAAAETSPAPDMPMLDAAAPQAADAGSLRQALTGTPSRRRTGARTLVPGIPTG